VGTWGGGLDRFNEPALGEGTFSHYRYDPDDPSSLGNDLVASIYEDRSGTLWVATFGGGLITNLSKIAVMDQTLNQLMISQADLCATNMTQLILRA